MSSFARWRREVLGWMAGLIAGVDYFANGTVSFSSAQIRAGIGVTPDQFLWVLTGYAAAGALMILCLERLLRLYHIRTLLLAGLTLFVLGAVMAASSQTLPQLIVARVVQGLGGGPLMTCARVMLQLTVPAERRPGQLRGFIYGIFLAAAPGPWLAATLMQAGDWHALFWLQAVLGAVVALLAWRMLPGGVHVTRPVGRLDGWAVLALCLGVLLSLHALEDLAYQRADAGWWLRILLAGALLLVLFWRMWQHPDPWLQLSTLASRRFVLGLLFYVAYYLINGAVSITVPQYLAQGQGINLTTTGALISLGGLGTLLCLPGYFRLSPFLPSRRLLMAAGCVLLAWILWGLASGAAPDVSWTRLWPWLLLKGLFPVLVVVQLAGLTFREFRHLDFVHAYALKNLLRLLAMAAGSGLADVFWQNVTARARTALAAGYDSQLATQLGLVPGNPEGWSQLSRMVEQQAALLAASQTFAMVACACLLTAVLLLLQKTFV
ncbi:MFS transporter [Paludibacterium sp. B53371]|uniref:MFS transporter n=1 Tax=Paludibacterium sp. B53371 TaxID=2806263 RepID=UPI001C03F2EC|nr:MFS transporter [Paludibacterium sp. B53371]